MSNRPPVLLQIIPELSAGGAEQGCLDMAIAIVKAGGTSLLISHGGTRLHEAVRAGVKQISLPVHSKNPFVMIQNIGRLRKIIKDHQVDLVHVRSRAPAWSAWYAVRGTFARFMTTCHAPYAERSRLKRFYNAIMGKGERVIAISDFVAHYAETLLCASKDRIRIIPRGIAIEKFHPSAVTPERLIKLSSTWRVPEGAHVVLLPGRLTRWKGHAVFIDALARLAQLDVFGLIIGSDQGRSEYTQELLALIAARGLEGRMRIVDHCADMPAAYMLGAVVVSASTAPEGFGRVPVEAQAMGRPVIATNHGGAAETIIDTVTGWLVPPSDPEALAQKIQYALALSHEERVALAYRAMDHVQRHFTKERMIFDTLAVYNELLPKEAPLALPSLSAQENVAA